MMRFKAVSLNKLDDETIMQIRVWRNQDFVRNMMFNSEIIGEEEHLNWINALKNDKNRDLFLFYIDEKPFAVIQYKYHEDGNYVEMGDYLISEEYQYMGYGTIMRYYTLVLIFDYLGFDRMCGEIRDINSKNIRTTKRIYGNERVVLKEKDAEGNKTRIYVTDINKEDWKNDVSKRLEQLIYKIMMKEYDIIS